MLIYFQYFRYIMRRGSSGVYLYAILERLEGWPDMDMDQIRIVFKLQNDKYIFFCSGYGELTD